MLAVESVDGSPYLANTLLERTRMHQKQVEFIRRVADAVLLDNITESLVLPNAGGEASR